VTQASSRAKSRPELSPLRVALDLGPDRLVRGPGEGGEAGADVVGVGRAEIRVEDHRMSVVFAGACPIAEGVVGVAEAGVGAGLQVPGAGAGGDGEGVGVVVMASAGRPAA
jgi:hypothetical protein